MRTVVTSISILILQISISYCADFVRDSTGVFASDSVYVSSHRAPPDFGFRIYDGGGEEINSFDGTYTRDYVCDPDTTIPFVFTTMELDSVYSALVLVDFFKLNGVGDPRYISGVTASGDRFARVRLLFEFNIEACANGIRKRFSVGCDTETPGFQCAKLMKLFWFIRGIVASSEGYKKLSEPRCGYL